MTKPHLRKLPKLTALLALPLVAGFLLTIPQSARAAFVWVEAESASEKTVFSNPWWESVRKSGLSGNDWIASFSETGQETGSATIPFTVPEAGEYTLWLRLGRGGTGYAWAIDGGEMQPVDIKALQQEDKDNRRTEGYVQRVQDEHNLALDGTTDARYLTWIRTAQVQLDAGKHTLKVSLGGSGKDDDKRFGSLDAFVLTTEAFQPNGQFKPGETNPRLITYDDDQMWQFTPEPDTFSDEALWDLRDLNEDVAGQHGFIKRSEDGLSFVRGDGEPIRFWGGSDYNQRKLTIDEMKTHAEFLAKRGVNIVRWHGHLPPNLDRKAKQEGKTTNMTDVDEEHLDEAFKLVAGMKDAGIYTILSPYWGSHTDIEEGWDVPSPGGNRMSALVFFVPQVKEAYKSWLRELYTRENPYTGVPLKDEPAVAIIQLQNEDSMLFFTMQGVKGEAEMLLRKQFAEWLTKKYGSLEKAREAWKNYEYNGDKWEENLPALFIVWEFTDDAMKQKSSQPGFLERRADQLQFFGETMYNFNEEIETYLEEELGCKQLVNAGNWRTVDPVLVDPVERWSYTANEVIGKNHYFGALHTGKTRGWQILGDHIFTNKSATKEPGDLPTNVVQPKGHPFIIPESLWVPPNKYESEGPLIIASQQALSGVDTFYWFANGVPQWVDAVSGGPGSSLTKWTYATPMQLGQFPASALLYREGYLEEAAEPVVDEHRSLENLWEGRYPLIAESGAFDPNRDEGNFAPEAKVDSETDPLAFLVGPVHVTFDSDPQKTTVKDLSEYIDHDTGVIKSITGQITIETKPGLYEVSAPKVQGVAGFLGSQEAIDLGDVKVRSTNEFATITTIALDDKPLTESQKVLVQIGTFQRPTGWTIEEVDLEVEGEPTPAYRIVTTGENPWAIRKAEGQVMIKNSALKTATVLDSNAMPTGKAALQPADAGWVTLQLPEDALYVVLTP